MKRTEFAYIKKYKTKTYCIMYQWGSYYVVEMNRKEDGTACIAVNSAKRKYKTVSGAERYLLSLASACDGATKPEILYGSERFIQEGSYWR